MTDIASFEHVHVGEYFALFRREKWRAFAVGSVILALAVGVVAVWPSTYQSTATILVEESDVPAGLVVSATSAYASERIQAIQQRIITTANLVGIINKFNLYADERQSTPVSQIAELMKADIALSIVSADTASKGGRDTRAAIAFTLSFDGDTPRTTQQVTNELATLFLSESQRDRDERTSGTTSFLEAEAQRLHSEVETLESKLETFRTENAGYLPEDRAINQQLLDRADSQLLDLSRQIQTLRDRQGMLQGQLARTGANLPSAPGDRASLSPADQLAMLQAKRSEMSARYGPKHPDVIAIDRQIAALKDANSAGAIGTSALKLQVQNLQAQLQTARQKYGPKHPDTLKLERELTAAQEQLASAPKETPLAPNNPDYLQIQVELSSVNGELAAAITQQQATEDKKSKIEERLFRGPAVERDYIALKRDYDAAVAKYLDLRSKESDAEVTKNLETQRMGETLTLIEPPAEPIAPIKPNRRAILAVGLLAAIAGGIGIGILHDTAVGRVHGWRQLAAIAGQSPFAVIPLIRTDADRRSARRIIMLQILLGLLVLGAILFYVNSFVMPLNLLLANVAERFGLLPATVTPSVGN